MKRVIIQLRAELMLIARNGEQLLLTVVIPLILLGFFGAVDILPSGESDPLEFLVPGVLAVAISIRLPDPLGSPLSVCSSPKLLVEIPVHFLLLHNGGIAVAHRKYRLVIATTNQLALPALDQLSGEFDVFG